MLKMLWGFVLFLLPEVVRVFGSNDVLMSQSVLYGLSSLTQNHSNKSTCYDQLGSLFQAIQLNHVWALKALDASGVPGPGFLYGNNLWLGSHAQCSDISNLKQLEINHKRNIHPSPTAYDYPPYPMGFTMVYIKHNSTMQYHTQQPLEFTIQLGLCIPRTCQNKEIVSLTEEYLEGEHLYMQHLYNLNLTAINIRNLETNTTGILKLSKTILLIVLTGTVLLLAITGTVYDVKTRKKAKNFITGPGGIITGSKTSAISVSEVELVARQDNTQVSTLGQILKCFSVPSNVRSLVKTTLPPDSVPEIHGLRFFGMLWVIMVHAVFYQTDYLENVPIGYRLSEDIFSQILSNSTYAVDTYLFLSGFLVAYLFYKSQTKGDSQHPVNYSRQVTKFFMMCFQRFLRLTPPYIVVILFSDVMYTYYRQTSSLISSESPDVVCSKYWWRNILYINNLYPRHEMCLSWSWYLSADTQFFVITAFLLLLSTVFFKTSALIIILLIIVNIIATTLKSYSIGYIPTMDEQLAQLDALYDLPWNRIGPYLIGVITAYILLVKLQRKLHLRESIRLLLWVIFPLLNLWILFTLYSRQLSVEFSAVYMGVSRTLWGIGLAWLMVACCTGNAGILQKFLSFRGWIPLSRLTYCAYLLNPLLANMLYLGSGAAFNASIASFSLTVQGVVMSSFFTAFLFSILFESPFVLLTKLIFSKVVRDK